MDFPHTLTVFNQVGDEDEPTYIKSTIQYVLFVKDENTARNKLGIANADTITVYVPANVNEVNGKWYLESADYTKLSDTDKEGKYTFRKGDFISLGDTSLDELSINEYKNLNENIYEITGLSDYRFGGLPNLVLSAR